MNRDTQMLLDVACDAALSAGYHLRTQFGKKYQLRFKDKHDPVTQVDTDAEKIILEVLRKNYPEHGFFSEEGGLQQADNPFCWIIDPLDGTMNFLHGFAFFGVSIALQMNDKTIVGVVYHPMTDELYTAVHGHGAYLHKERLKVSRLTNLSESLLGTGFGTTATLRCKQHLLLSQYLLPCGAIRETGSAALGLCNVARGIYDGYWELGLHLWDIAAGMLIVTEAEGIVSHLDSAPLNNQVGDILASNGLLHQALLHLNSLIHYLQNGEA